MRLIPPCPDQRCLLLFAATAAGPVTLAGLLAEVPLPPSLSPYDSIGPRRRPVVDNVAVLT